MDYQEALDTYYGGVNDLKTLIPLHYTQTLWLEDSVDITCIEPSTMYLYVVLEVPKQCIPQVNTLRQNVIPFQIPWKEISRVDINGRVIPDPELQSIYKEAEQVLKSVKK